MDRRLCSRHPTRDRATLSKSRLRREPERRLARRGAVDARRGGSRVDREEMIRMELAARDLHAFQENRVGPRSELGLSAICTEGTTRQVSEADWCLKKNANASIVKMSADSTDRAIGQVSKEGARTWGGRNLSERLGNRTEAVGGPTLPAGGPACGPPTDDDASAPTPDAERERIEANLASIAPRRSCAACARSASRVPIRRKGERFSSSSATRSPAP